MSWHDNGKTNSSDSAHENLSSDNESSNGTANKKAEKKPTPITTQIEVKTKSVLSEDGKGNFMLSAIDIKNNTTQFVFPKEYWENQKYGKIGEQFKKKASSEEGIRVILHFFVYKNKKYVAKIGR